MEEYEGFFFTEEKSKRKLTKRSVSRKEKLTGCEACGLYKEVNSPKIAPYGNNKKGALIQGEGPGGNEDLEGIPFCGKVGQDFRPYFKRYGIHFVDDCVTINTLDCRPTDSGGNNRKPKTAEIKYCYHRKAEAYEKYKPSVIFLLGDSAIDSFYGCDPDRRKAISPRGKEGMLSLAALRGQVIPDRKLQAWVCHGYHPSFITRGNQDLEHIFDLDFAVFASMVGKPRPSFELHENNIEILYEYEQVINFLDDVWVDPFAFDYESSSYRYWEKIHRIHMISVAFTGEKAFVFPYDFIGTNGKPYWKPRQFRTIGSLWKDKLKGRMPKIAQHIKHEEKASRACLGTEVNNWDWCTMTAAHLLNEIEGTTGQKVQVYMKWGYTYGEEVDPFLKCDVGKTNRFEELPIDTSGKYCGEDSKWCMRLANIQKRLIRANGLQRAYDLFHDGSLALLEMEQEGIRINVDLGKQWYKEWTAEIDELKDKIMSSKEIGKFERFAKRLPNYKKSFSGKDMQILLYDVLGFKPIKETKTGYSVDQETLSNYEDKCEVVKLELRRRKLYKKKSYLTQYLKMQVDGFIYPSFLLHVAKSYRSSSREPNFQNVFKHDEKDVVFRKLIIAREGNYLETVDYGAMEFRIIACVTKDKVAIAYILDGRDIHGDCAHYLFGVDNGDTEFENLRYIAKNKSVFRFFYGGFYKQVARDTFEYSGEKYYTRWERHCKDYEDWFWNKFKGVREWQNDYVNLYKKQGYARDYGWGFMRRGYLDRNKLFNFPIQGASFHCLLWSIIELMKEKNKWESKTCAEIHDDLFNDTVPSESEARRKRIDEIMTEEVREANPWIIVPLVTEWKRGVNWFEMEDIK